MSEVKQTDTSLLNTYQDMFLTHQKFFPYTNLAKRYTQAACYMMEAQANYVQSLIRAQATLLGADAWRAKSATEIGPCEATMQPEYMSE